MNEYRPWPKRKSKWRRYAVIAATTLGLTLAFLIVVTIAGYSLAQLITLIRRY